MKSTLSHGLHAALLSTLLALGALAVATPAAAKNDDAPGQSKKHGQGNADKGNADKGDKGNANKQSREAKVGAYFTVSDRDSARHFYEQRYTQAGRCPPGLAKKNNGCMPPGQAKKYNVGQPLPSGVVFYPVAPGVLIHLPPVPVNHRYVRVAADILLIAVGTQMVVDAMTDLAR
jgi:uncharacterized membrane protein